MRFLRLAALGAALMLSGCATINYLSTEYGSADPDATVTSPAGNGFWIFAHKSKPKLMVSVDPQSAAGMGMVSGLTFGATTGGPVYAEFDAVAKDWVAKNRPQCRLGQGHPIEKVYYEYDLDCGPVVTQAPRPKGRS